MITVRRSNERGHADHGWLEAYHTFSFAGYHDPDHMGFRTLRVINEDRVEPGQGFGTHPHADMEILTYLIEGQLEHRDSMGNGRIIKAGEVQGMSAGTGVTHSEFNPSDKERTHLLQIWIKPDTRGVFPAYGEWIPSGREHNNWALAASADGAEGSIIIHQDARLYVSTASAGQELCVPVAKGRFGWIQIAKGEVEIEGKILKAGDGASFSGGDFERLKVTAQSKILLFDLS